MEAAVQDVALWCRVVEVAAEVGDGLDGFLCAKKTLHNKNVLNTACVCVQLGVCGVCVACVVCVKMCVCGVCVVSIWRVCAWCVFRLYVYSYRQATCASSCSI